MPKVPFTLALVGATGEVGRAALDAIDQLELPVKAVRPFATSRSAGERIEVLGDEVKVATLADGAFRGCDVAIFCAGPDVARTWAPKAWAEGCAVVDDSPAFRGEADVPLVVPEVNADALAGFRARGRRPRPRRRRDLPGGLRPRPERRRGARARGARSARPARARAGGALPAPDRVQRHPARRGRAGGRRDGRGGRARARD